MWGWFGWKEQEERAKSGWRKKESEDKEWHYHDNFFGGEPYGGREVIFCHDQPVWMMVYYGEVSDKSLDKKIVYATSVEAIRSN